MPLLRGLLPLLLLLTFSWLFLDSVGGGDAYSSVDGGRYGGPAKPIDEISYTTDEPPHRRHSTSTPVQVS